MADTSNQYNGSVKPLAVLGVDAKTAVRLSDGVNDVLAALIELNSPD